MTEILIDRVVDDIDAGKVPLDLEAEVVVLLEVVAVNVHRMGEVLIVLPDVWQGNIEAAAGVSFKNIFPAKKKCEIEVANSADF